MKVRPTSVTVIAWIFIVSGVVSIITLLLSKALTDPKALALMSKSLLPISVQFAMMFIGLTVTIVSGIGLLKGLNWARLLYVIWSVIGFVIGLITSPAKVAMIPSIVFFLIVTAFLFSPKVTEYFLPQPSDNA